jgi:hypothetical protein
MRLPLALLCLLALIAPAPARIVANLKATAEALAAELGKLEGRARHYPRRGRAG